LPNDAETIPLPKEETTPPVTKMYFVSVTIVFFTIKPTKVQKNYETTFDVVNY